MSQVSERIGQVFMMRSPRLASVRDRVLRLLDRIPRVHRFTENVEFKPPPIYAAGAFLDGHHRRGQAPGTLMVQPLIELADGQKVRLDDALGPAARAERLGPALQRAIGTPAADGVR